MRFLPNRLCIDIAKHFSEGKRIICNEGGSRAGKTWDTFHFIVLYCSQNKKPQDIFIIRDTLVNCRDFTLKEFQDCLIMMGIYNSGNMINSPKPVYTLWGHKIKFRGLDDEKAAEGYPSDILFFNEALENTESGMKGLIMRCRRFVIMDWNPKYTDHHLFKYEKRDDCVFTKTTYKNNINNLPPAVIKEIQSYDPQVPANVTNGTADKYRWAVYGLGQRANREGLVFPDVTWIDAFPTKEIDRVGKKIVVDDVDAISYGCDFGETAQTAIVKTAIRKAKDGIGKDDLFLQKLFYHPTENSDVVIEVMKGLDIPQHVWCDSNMPGWIGDMRRADLQPLATKKFPGSREYWITSIKKYNIHIVKDVDFRKEQENFSYRVVDGKQLSETIKKHDHLWSATGYSIVGDFRVKE